MTTLRRIAPFRTFTITQLCREFDCTARALRFYEEQGLLSPRRDQMQRIYSYKDRARLKLIIRGRRVGLTVSQIRKILESYDAEGEAAQKAVALQIFKSRLASVEAEQARLEQAKLALMQACERLAGGGGSDPDHVVAA